MTTVEELADRQAIEDMLLRHVETLDARDWAAHEAAFIPDARIVIDSVGEFTGARALLDLVAPRMEALVATQHYLTNFVVTIDGDSATSSAYLMSQHIRPGGAWMIHGGIYDDELVRTEHGWKIGSHTIRLTWEQTGTAP